MSELPPHLRAFVAVRIPEDVITQVAAFQNRLKPDFSAVSWTRPTAMHVTLQFLGNIGSARLSELKEELRQATKNAAPFRLGLAGLGCFGNRVLWIGIEIGVDSLNVLANAVRNATNTFAAHHETRAFNAHVTLGRLREPMRGASAMLRKTPPPVFQPWKVDHFELIRSELSPKGSRYTTLETFPLPLMH